MPDRAVPSTDVLQELFERCPHMLAGATLHGRLTYVNPAWRATFGASGDGTLPGLAHPDDRASIEHGLRAAPATGRHRLRAADGGWRLVLWSVVPAAAPGEVHVAIAQHGAAEDQLDAIATAISHDLRAPIRAVDGFARVLLGHDAEALPDDTRRFLELMLNAAGELGAMSDALVEILRMAREPLHRERVDAAAQAREVTAALGAPGVTVVIDDLPPADADPELLRRVWRELLGNAVRFGATRVTVSWDAARCAYLVRDDGVGFGDERQAARAFVLFARVHDPALQPSVGVGAGLAIVAQIAALHGGGAGADSRAGDGATVWFTLDAGGGTRTPTA